MTQSVQFLDPVTLSQGDQLRLKLTVRCSSRYEAPEILGAFATKVFVEGHEVDLRVEVVQLPLEAIEKGAGVWRQSYEF